jgi:hypothetical protein
VGFVSRFGLGEGEGLTCREGRLARRLAIVRRADRPPSAATTAFEEALKGKPRKQGSALG